MSHREGRKYGGATVAEAAQMQAEGAVEDLIRSGMDPNTRDSHGNTGLHWAVWFNNPGLISFLLQSGASMELGNSAGETPVHWAAKAGHLRELASVAGGQILGWLVTHRDNDGFTPFIVSAQFDGCAAMEWMYLRGVCIEDQDNLGRTALHWACYKGHRKTTQWLLSRGANIRHREVSGMTPLHWCAHKGHDQLANMLIDAGGVDLCNAPDSSGVTPVKLARKKGYLYFEFCLQKCRLCTLLIGRPFVSHNAFANCFVVFVTVTILLFLTVIAPYIAADNWMPCVSFLGQMTVALFWWARSCFRDPGWLGPATVGHQGRRAGADTGFDPSRPVESQMEEVDEKSRQPLMPNRLEELETSQTKLTFQRLIINEAAHQVRDRQPVNRSRSSLACTGGAPDSDLDSTTSSCSSQLQELQRNSYDLAARMRASADEVARERRQALVLDSQEMYLKHMDDGSFKRVCVICRRHKTMRSHHCKDCGRCVDRLDHHCPWIDNCVGVGNQREFVCFITQLLGAILSFYWCVAVFLLGKLRAAGEDLGMGTVPERVWSQLGVLVVVCDSVFNLIWLGFVGALVLRHTVYMMVNITTFEVLVRPSHVCRRFPSDETRFWFTTDFSLSRAFRSTRSFWTLSSAHDEEDFRRCHNSAPGDGFESDDSFGPLLGEEETPEVGADLEMDSYEPKRASARRKPDRRVFPTPRSSAGGAPVSPSL
mmetsp:Transcript_116922/g.268330  ORF Transcript_116922/g.268330 Transcript_116922/m.268330 type:complete len:709 (-) Transcript_116922:166-2292(-)